MSLTSRFRRSSSHGPAPAADSLPGQHIARFAIARLLGQGASGAVYLAQDSSTGDWVALKTVTLSADAAASADGHDRFVREAQAVGRLRHPDIVAVLDAGRVADLGWIAMELVAGTNLTRYTHPGRLLPQRLVARLGARVAGALAHAHGQGVVHRDVKPANVLVDWAHDVVKLGDFGIARWADQAQTRSGQALGSPDYMAPEQLAGGDVGSSADLYGLGATLYELLCGHRPHSAPTLGALLRAVANDPPIDLSTRDPGLAVALTGPIMAALSRQPARRPANARLMAEALERAYVSLAGDST